MNPKGLWAAGLCLLLAGPAYSEELCCGAKERAGFAAGKSAGAPAWQRDRREIGRWADYNRRISWYENIQEAQNQAVRQGKMLFGQTPKQKGFGALRF